MNLSLKSIKYAAFLSEETAAFSATLCNDGKPFATVSNDGHGGCDLIIPLPGKLEVLKKAQEFAKSLPPNPLRISPTRVEMIPMDLDQYIARLLDLHLRNKQIARINKKSVAFCFPNDEQGTIRVYKGRGWTREALLADLKAKHPEAVLL